jgi:hypothetical protein
MLDIFSNKKFVLFIDEADLRRDDFDDDFLQLQKLSDQTVFVSATTQDIIVSNWNIKCCNILEIEKSPFYKGIENIEWVCNWDLSSDENYQWIFCDIAYCNKIQEFNPYHPIICLIIPGS